jgi:hypothetical protein
MRATATAFEPRSQPRSQPRSPFASLTTAPEIRSPAK